MNPFCRAKCSPIVSAARPSLHAESISSAYSTARLHAHVRPVKRPMIAATSAAARTPELRFASNVEGSRLVPQAPRQPANNLLGSVPSSHNSPESLPRCANAKSLPKTFVTQSHLRYGTVGLRAGFLCQHSRPRSFIPIRAHRYARLQGTLLRLSKSPGGEIVWTFDIAGSVVKTFLKSRKIIIYAIDGQRRKHRVMVLVATDAQSFQKWSLWLTRASQSVLELHYSVDRLIGKGAFASVVLGKDLRTGEDVAIKLIEKSSAPSIERKYFEREANIMQALSHQNVVRCYDIFDTRLRARIVMEYMAGGTLGDVIRKHPGPIPEHVAKRIMRGILSGVEYLHAKGIVHRDLKPDNCLLSSPTAPYGLVKLSDFGLSNVVKGGMHGQSEYEEENDILTSAVGSPAFIAPEVLESKYDAAVDIWSCGVIAYMVLSGGAVPFAGYSASEIIARARRGGVDFSSQSLRQISGRAKEFVRALLNVDSRERLTASQALAHPWFSDR